MLELPGLSKPALTRFSNRWLMYCLSCYRCPWSWHLNIQKREAILREVVADFVWRRGNSWMICFIIVLPSTAPDRIGTALACVHCLWKVWSHLDSEGRAGMLERVLCESQIVVQMLLRTCLPFLTVNWSWQGLLWPPTLKWVSAPLSFPEGFRNGTATLSCLCGGLGVVSVETGSLATCAQLRKKDRGISVCQGLCLNLEMLMPFLHAGSLECVCVAVWLRSLQLRFPPGKYSQLLWT